MEHVLTAIVLSAALLASGVLRSLFTFASPARERRRPKVKTRPRAAAAPPARSATRRAKTARGGRARSRPRPSAREATGEARAPAGTYYRECRPDQTLVGRSQLNQLAQRLSRLETALDVGGASIPTSSPSRSQEVRSAIVEQFRRGLGPDEIARISGLSRGEVELMLKMHVGDR